jgi:hypothetical protein
MRQRAMAPRYRAQQDLEPARADSLLADDALVCRSGVVGRCVRGHVGGPPYKG